MVIAVYTCTNGTNVDLQVAELEQHMYGRVIVTMLPDVACQLTDLASLFQDRLTIYSQLGMAQHKQLRLA